MTDTTTWRKSSRSGSTSNCIEVRSDLNGLRDSKQHDGPVLRGNVTALIAAIRDGLTR